MDIPFDAYLHSRLGTVAQAASFAGIAGKEDLDDEGLLRPGVDANEASSTKPSSKHSDKRCWGKAPVQCCALTLQALIVRLIEGTCGIRVCTADGRRLKSMEAWGLSGA